VADLERAGALAAAGERSVRAVFGPDAVMAPEAAWADAAPPAALRDVDTPEALAAAGLAPPAAGDDWVALSRCPLSAALATQWATVPGCGAVVAFSGTVRDHAEDRQGVQELAYEAYEGPALARMAEVAAEARRRWPEIGRVAVLHRLGRLALGETAVVVAVSTGHRAEAFAAAEWVIDTVKASVPIWKYERWADGEDWGTGAQAVAPVAP
jgi:molybdopterin synthase catalytic subunit